MSPHSWQKQELFKGTRYLWLPGLEYSGGTTTAGWGFETISVDADPDGYGRHHFEPAYTPAAAAAAALEEPSPLITNPVFRHTPEWLVGTSVLTQPEQNEMLAKGIPALTPSAGRTTMNEEVFPSGQQFDMNIGGDGADSFKPNGWPRTHPEYGTAWLHNDVRVMAFLYTFRGASGSRLNIQQYGLALETARWGDILTCNIQVAFVASGLLAWQAL